MNRLEIDANRCKACRLCIQACSKKLLVLSTNLNEKGYHPVMLGDTSACIACALCATVCPEGAISVFKKKK